MRVEIHVFHHDETLARKLDEMSEKLTAAIAALTADVQTENTKLDSIETFVKGNPDVVAAAVADALAKHDVDDDAAAVTIEEARAAMAAKVDEVLGAVNANTPAETTAGPDSGPATVAGDPGADSVTGAAGDDSING